MVLLLSVAVLLGRGRRCAVAAQSGLLGRRVELRTPAQLLHQLLAILRVDQLVDALVTNVRLRAISREEWVPGEAG